MFAMYDLFDDENTGDVQEKMNQAVKEFESKHAKVLNTPSEWTEDMRSTMLVQGYFGAFSFTDFYCPEMDNFFEQYESKKLPIDVMQDLTEMFYTLEQLYNSLSGEVDY